MSGPGKPSAFQLRLPATSANLGPGFDAVAVALDVFLEIEAEPAQEFSVTASGRDADRCVKLEDNLIFETYKQILRTHQRAIVPLAIRMVNGIPLGMGCGSSAAARLAAIALAVHFGELGLGYRPRSRRGVQARRSCGQRGGVLAWRICRRGVRGNESAGGANRSARRVASDCRAAQGAALNQQSARSFAGEFSA